MQGNTADPLTMFELHTLRGGAWKVDSMYDDKELAVEMAERIVSSRRSSAVRVVEETFTDNGIRSRVVFRKSQLDDANADAAKRQLQVQKDARLSREQGATRTTPAQGAARTQGGASQAFTWLFVKLVGIGVFGLVALLVLERMILHH
jgi:hypothetical protein